MIAFIIIVLYIALLCTLSNIGDCCRKNIKNKISMKKYRKKPVVIEAVQWNGKNFDECMNFMGEHCGNKIAYEDYEEKCLQSKTLTIKTIEGNMIASKDDYIIKGVNGEFYPCKPDIFEKTYEEV